MSSSTTDQHANARDRKRKRALEQKTMRGNRSVFEIEKAIVKRGHKANRAVSQRSEKRATQ